MKPNINRLLLVIMVMALGLATYLYAEVRQLKAGPQIATADEVKAIVAKVGRLVVLPAKEVPTLATVVDPNQLKSQPFFALAKKGDKVLIYRQAARAVLYDPVQDKVVEVGPVNLGQSN